MTSWIDYVKIYAKENNIKYKDALKAASASYKQKKETKTEDTIKKVELIEDVVIPETKPKTKKSKSKV